MREGLLAAAPPALNGSVGHHHELLASAFDAHFVLARLSARDVFVGWITEGQRCLRTVGVEGVHDAKHIIDHGSSSGRNFGMLPNMADADEPDELDRKIKRARRKMDAGRKELMDGIAEAIALGRTNARISRQAEWSETRIKQLRAATRADDAE